MVDTRHLKRLAAAGLRGEVVFPTPCLFAANPFLLGYYRLLYGFSQKAFYEQGPFSAFKTMESKGVMLEAQRPYVVPLCSSLIESGALLLGGIEPVTLDIVNDLQLLTLGPQLRGSRNVDVGQSAVTTMHSLLSRLLSGYSPRVKRRTIEFTNDSELPVRIHFGGDPDIAVTMRLGTENRKLLAVEIKGGADASNIWNRLGEAEKSHQSARKAGFNELWTVTGVDLGAEPAVLARAKEKSPSTTRFFFLPKISGQQSPEGTSFRQLLGSIVGAKLSS